MSSNKQDVKYLKDYKESDFLVNEVNLIIDLYDNKTIVTNEMIIKKKNNTQNLILDGEKQKLLEIYLDNKKLNQDEYELSKKNLTIYNVPKNFKIIIKTEIHPEKNTSLEGLYIVDNYFLTQCEPHGFRKITYYIDRPDIMSVFTTKIIADKKFKTLLSNGNRIEKGELNKDRHYVVWHDSSKKPSYLFAAVIGNLNSKKDQYVTKSGKKIALEFYTANEDVNKLDYAIYSLKEAMKWDELNYNREYDLDIYMVVGSPKFNAGAMENKGLNIFNDKYILSSPDNATDNDYINIYGVIGHEYFHNWTGNRITLRDWFHLTLKEGLTVLRDQDFTADKFFAPLKRIEDANIIKSYQFPEDSGPLAHPIRPESYIKMDNFYTVTVYNKGAEVIRMIPTLLGKDKYLKGMELYFKKYDGHAVSVEDFLSSFEEANKIDLKQFKLWYSSAGTPLVTVNDFYDQENKTYKLELTQFIRTDINQDPKPLVIPIKIGFIGSNSGKNLLIEYNDKKAQEFILNFNQTKQNFIFKNVNEKPIPSLLRDFSAPIKIKYDYQFDDLIQIAKYDNNQFNQWNALQELFTRYIIQLTENIKNNIDSIFDTRINEVIKYCITNKTLDNQFIAMLLIPPSEKAIYEEFEEIDPEIIYQAREFILNNISINLKSQFINKHDELAKKLLQLEYSPEPEQIADRTLKNTLLSFIARADKNKAEILADKQLNEANNFTDRVHALLAISKLDQSTYHKYFNDFYNKWSKDELIVNKWLMLQSSADRKDIIRVIKDLLIHQAFDIKVPNKVYAVIGAFMANLHHFHKIDGSGYKLVTEFLIKLDKVNPHVAARIIRGFSHYKKLEPKRKALMKEALNLISKANPSENSKEIITTILT